MTIVAPSAKSTRITGVQEGEAAFPDKCQLSGCRTKPELVCIAMVTCHQYKQLIIVSLTLAAIPCGRPPRR